jgi:hypothetical protein
MRQPTIHQMREKKNHRGKVEEVERLQYLFEFPLGTNVLPKSRILCQC